MGQAASTSYGSHQRDVRPRSLRLHSQLRSRRDAILTADEAFIAEMRGEEVGEPFESEEEYEDTWRGLFVSWAWKK